MYSNKNHRVYAQFYDVPFVADTSCAADATTRTVLGASLAQSGIQNSHPASYHSISMGFLNVISYLRHGSTWKMLAAFYRVRQTTCVFKIYTVQK